MGTSLLNLGGSKKERVFIPDEGATCDCYAEGLSRVFVPCEGCPYRNPAVSRIVPGNPEETARITRLERENPLH